MSETYHKALRAWEAAPEDLGAFTTLVRISKRLAQVLPSAINPKLQFVSLVEVLNDTYELMSQAGYDHTAAGGFTPLKPPYENLAAVCDAISQLNDSEYERDDDYTLPYPCLTVHSVSAIHELSFPHIGYSPERLPEKLVQPFARLRETTEDLSSRFPDAQFFDVSASYPDNGEVYWDITNLIYLPAFGQSFVLCIQHYW